MSAPSPGSATSDPSAMTTAGGLPTSWYSDPAVYERERAAIFGREWLFAGHVQQFNEPGHYVALVVAGYPLVVVNDAGTLRGFPNVCRHRGGPLVWDGAGACPAFVCRYHGWSYGLDGALRSARDFGDQQLCADELSLHPVQVEAWRGLVFVNLDLDTPPLVDWLGGMAAECDDFAMESFVVAERSSHDIAANWKVYAENYQEGYHIPLVHPGLHRQIDSRRYEVEVRDTYCVHRAPTRDGSVTAGAWLWRFPGLALNVYPGGMCVESYTPTGPATTRVEYHFFFAEATPESERHASMASSTAILDEDRDICEAVQRNITSGLFMPGPLSPRHEGGVAAVQALVRRALDTPTS